jgi:hypothetical protein
MLTYGFLATLYLIYTASAVRGPENYCEPAVAVHAVLDSIGFVSSGTGIG